MTREEYIKRIVKELDCDKKDKKRIQSDLENDIKIALQHGETMEEIIDRMGSPEEIAMELGYGIADTTDRKTYSGNLFYIVGAICIFVAGFLMHLVLNKIVNHMTVDGSFQESFYYMICWLILLIILIVVEIPTMGLTTIWFAGGSFIALLIALAGGSQFIQVVFFCVITAILLFITRPIAIKYFNRTREKTNVDQLVGKTIIITKDVDNLKESGEAVIGGITWTVRSVNDTQKIAKGDAARVIKISGAKLVVKKLY